MNKFFMKLFMYIKVLLYVVFSMESFFDVFHFFNLVHFYDEDKFKIWDLKRKIKVFGFKIKNVKKDFIIFSNGKINCTINHKYPYIFYEIFLDEIYKFHDNIIDANKKYIVFDIGANRGYASLYFASKQWCDKVYAFELFPQNIKEVQKNLSINNENISGKIKLYDFGLSNKDTEILANYFENRDGISSMNEDFLSGYAPEEKGNEIKTVCKIQQASKVLKEIVDSEKIDNIIIKIDVEGAEYDIFDDLSKNYPELFEKTIKIIGDTHLGFDKFYNMIKQFEYKIVWKEPHTNNTCPFELSK